MKRDKKIIVGIDIRDLQIAKTGQRTVMEEFCRQFRSREDSRFSFLFFDTRFPAYTGKNKWILLLEHLRYQCWKQIELPVKAWRNHCDILFCVDYFVPIVRLGFKTVEIFHDAFFFEYPGHYNKLWLKLFHNIAMPAARKCAYIITVTDYARKKVHQYTGIPEKKLVTIYPGPKTLLQSAQPASLPGELDQLKDQKYILHVGVIEKRKNLPMLIQACKLLVEQGYPNLKLVLVGQGNGKKYSDDTEALLQAIQIHKLENHVLLTGYLSDEALEYVYRHALMYVFPSINEGFGIPIMEAFSFNLPVLVANNSCLPEVGGDAVINFDPFNSQDICNKMKMVLDNDTLRKELIRKGQERLQDFSWEKAAGQLMDVFERAYREK